MLAALREAIGKTTDSYQLAALAQAYAAVAAKLKDTDPDAAKVLAALREAIGKTTFSYELAALAQAYAAVAAILKDTDPDAAKKLAALREAIGKTTFSYELAALAQAYAAVAAKLKDTDPDAAKVLARARGGARPFLQFPPWRRPMPPSPKLKDTTPTPQRAGALREAIGKTTFSAQLPALAQAYAAVAAKLKDTDPDAAKELAALREAIGKATFSHELRRLGAGLCRRRRQTQGHRPRRRQRAGRAARGHRQNHLLLRACRLGAGLCRRRRQTQKDTDTDAAKELAALSEAIGKTTSSDQLAALAQAYAAVAKRTRLPAPTLQDIAVLIGRISDLRTEEQAQAFAAAISEAVRLGSPRLPWTQVGLIMTAALLQPISAGRPTRDLVADYERFLRDHPNGVPQPLPTWAGDVWKFAAWARENQNLPKFDPHHPTLDFLPPVSPQH